MILGPGRGLVEHETERGVDAAFQQRVNDLRADQHFQALAIGGQRELRHLEPEGVVAPLLAFVQVVVVAVALEGELQLLLRPLPPFDHQTGVAVGVWL